MSEVLDLVLLSMNRNIYNTNNKCYNRAENACLEQSRSKLAVNEMKWIFVEEATNANVPRSMFTFSILAQRKRRKAV